MNCKLLDKNTECQTTVWTSKANRDTSSISHREVYFDKVQKLVRKICLGTNIKKIGQTIFKLNQHLESKKKRRS